MIRYRFNINESILYLDVPWTTLKEGQWVVMETFVNIDPEEDFKTWGDRIFQNLATAYIKRQWGENLTKFSGVQLAGGVQLNGDAILADAKAEIERIETDFIMKYQMPDDIFVG